MNTGFDAADALLAAKHGNLADWIGLCSVLRLRQHSIGYMGDGFYRSRC